MGKKKGLGALWVALQRITNQLIKRYVERVKEESNGGAILEATWCKLSHEPSGDTILPTSCVLHGKTVWPIYWDPGENVQRIKSIDQEVQKIFQLGKIGEHIIQRVHACFFMVFSCCINSLQILGSTMVYNKI